jgi:hypothetical protein
MLVDLRVVNGETGLHCNGRKKIDIILCKPARGRSIEPQDSSHPSSYNDGEGDDGRGSSEGVTKRDKRINPVSGITQTVAAKKKVITTAINPSRRIPYLKITNQVPKKERTVQERIK